jgi:mRNA interferase RelE/StbE
VTGRYDVVLTTAAERDLRRIAKKARKDAAALVKAIRSLGDDPRPPGCKKLSGRPAWRIRIGTYRVIYEVDDGNLVVTVVRAGHRRDVYE